MERDPGIVLHCCCGPCSTACIETLRGEGEEPLLVYCNDNICDKEEFDRRLASLRIVAEMNGLKLADLPYEHESWLADVRGLEGEPEGGTRCEKCFLHSLRRVAQFARERGMGRITSSLSVSPLKKTRMLFAAARLATSGFPRTSSMQSPAQTECRFQANGAGRAQSLPTSIADRGGEMPERKPDGDPVEENPAESASAESRNPDSAPSSNPNPVPVNPVDQQIEFVEYDFKKRNGYQRSVQLAKELGLYRQNFCGCEFSRR